MHLAVIRVITLVVPHLIQLLHLRLVSPLIRMHCIILELTRCWLACTLHVVRNRIHTSPHTHTWIAPPPLIHQNTTVSNVVIHTVSHHHLFHVLPNEPAAIIHSLNRTGRGGKHIVRRRNHAQKGVRHFLYPSVPKLSTVEKNLDFPLRLKSGFFSLWTIYPLQKIGRAHV